MADGQPHHDGTRVQLCGRFAARVAGRRIDRELPGRQGRLLFSYLAANRERVASRDELAEALWPRGLPSAPDLALSALLSKLRRLLPDGALEGRNAIRLELGRHARVDVEAARDGIHRAEALIAARDWYASIGPTLVAHNISQRRFLPGEEGAWIDERRRELEDIRVRALECTARRSLAIGGAEVAVAERTARRLIDLAPYRETGYALLMDSFERQGNIAEALRVYERLRGLLRDELGAAPSPRCSTCTNACSLTNQWEGREAAELARQVSSLGARWLLSAAPARRSHRDRVHDHDVRRHGPRAPVLSATSACCVQNHASSSLTNLRSSHPCSARACASG